MSEDHVASRDLSLVADAVNAWPAGWYYAVAPWQRTYTALVARHGRDRADAIVGGRDEATNADLAAWRQLGSKAAA